MARFKSKMLIVAAAASSITGCTSSSALVRYPHSEHLGQRNSATSVRPNAPLNYGELSEYYTTHVANGVGNLAAATGNVAGAAVSANAGGIIGAASGYPSARIYAAMPVKGDLSVRRFFYIRQDHLMRLAPPGTDPAVIERYRTFGPHPIGAEVRARVGFNYFFFPVCRDRFDSDRGVAIMAKEPPPIFTLTCRG